MTTTPDNNNAPYGTNTKSARARVGHQNGQTPSEQSRTPRLTGSPGEVIGDERKFLADGFGAQLKQLRTTTKLNQRETAGMAGISQVYLSRLERGHRRPTIDAVEALASVLAPDDQDTVKEHLARLAGDSLRESANRRRKRRESRTSLRYIAQLKRDIATNKGRVARLRAAGRHEVADLIEGLVETVSNQIGPREQAARQDLEALGDNPDSYAVPYQRRTPKHFRKRSYGPGTGRGRY